MTNGIIFVALTYLAGACGLLGGVAIGRSLARRRHPKGVVVLGSSVQFDGSPPFDVTIGRVIDAKPNSDRKRLSLLVSAEGVAVEVDLRKGEELLRQLYDARAWLHDLEEAR